MHLTPDQLLELAEGTVNDAAQRHVSTCAACQAQVREIAAMLETAKNDAVPEPSPLFWEQFSARVRESVAADPPRAGWQAWLRPWVLVPALTVLVAAVAGGTLFRAPAPVATPSPAIGRSSTLAVERDLLVDPSSVADDPSLVLVADLTSEMDWDTAQDAGLATMNSAEQAVSHLSDGELSELRRLLAEALARRGA